VIMMLLDRLLHINFLANLYRFSIEYSFALGVISVVNLRESVVVGHGKKEESRI
jgi:hypothetical protein